MQCEYGTVQVDLIISNELTKKIVVIADMEKENTPSPPMRSSMTRNDSSASSDFSHSSSHGSSDENEFPSNTSSWSIGLIDKFGIRKVMTNPFELIRTEWSLCNLTDAELARVDEIVKICS